MDRFQQMIKWPKGFSALSRDYFAERMVRTYGAHAKTYAGEVMSLIEVLGVFSDIFLAPKGLLREHVACLTLLRIINAIMMMGDRALSYTDTMREASEKYHKLFLNLYTMCARPKLHYMRHVPDCWARFRAALNCWACERKHKASKGLGAFCYKNSCKTLIAYEVQSLCDKLGRPETFQAIHLMTPVKSLKEYDPLFSVVAGASAVSTSNALTTDRGAFYKGLALTNAQVRSCRGALHSTHEIATQSKRGSECHRVVDLMASIRPKSMHDTIALVHFCVFLLDLMFAFSFVARCVKRAQGSPKCIQRFSMVFKSVQTLSEGFKGFQKYPNLVSYS